MKKFFLVAFIIVDLALIGGSSYVLFGYVAKHAPAPHPTARPAFTPTTVVPSTSTVTASSATMKAIGSPVGGMPTAPDSGARKILFSYHNGHAKQVSIRADFTGWKADSMQKAPNGVWTYLAHLTPGEYAYCYTADDKTFKDPANKRTKQIGRTLVSAIVVEALPSKPPK